jgi:hypothetical protein
MFNDRMNETYWMTTGIYPQSLTISFPQTRIISSLSITGFGSILNYNIKTIFSSILNYFKS